MGKKNAYVCSALHITVTEDLDHGTTPMFILCDTCKKAGRDNRAISQMYNVDDGIAATYEWYKPGDQELHKLTESMDTEMRAAMLEHVKKGGLLMRKIKQP